MRFFDIAINLYTHTFVKGNTGNWWIPLTEAK